ncbi:response regulator [Desulfobaculum senezii]|jgi:two-component system chemotaxis response regulator CheY
MGEPMRFLIVDDDFDSRRLMQKILYPYGYCDVAVDGEEAVEAFKRSLNNDEPYDLICLDIIMPNMDGQEALQEIREIETERGISDEARIKTVMISALDDTKELHDAFFLGEATSYLVKPIRKKTLLNEMRNLGLSIQLKEGQGKAVEA